METDTKNIYKTKDLGEAAAILVKKQKLLKIEREGKICWFVFPNAPTCLNISSDFYLGKLSANVREYYEAINMLKKIIFSHS